MEKIQPRLSYLILTLALMFPLVSWAQFDLASSSHTDITCNNIDEGVTNDGTITLTFDGASSARGKTVVWWKFNGTAFVALGGGDVPTQINNPAGGGNVGATSIQARNLGVGYYYAVITGASGEVETSPTFSISKPDPISLVVNTSATIDPLCIGGSTGQISVTAYGGLGTYSYAISTSNGSYTYNDADGIFPGLSDASNPTYHFSVQATSGSNTCTYDYLAGGSLVGTDITETLTDPPALNLGTVSSTNVVCFGESTGTVIMTAASGGTGSKLTYGIAANTTGTAPADGAYSFTNQENLGSGTTFTGISANTAGQSYFVAVQDENGCIAKANGAATTVNGPIADLSVGGFIRDNPSTIGGTNGSVQLSGGGATGGTPGYTYKWVKANGDQVGTDPNLTQATATSGNVPEETYTLTVTDANSCQKTFAQQTLTDCFDVDETIINLTGFELGNGSITLLPVVDNSVESYTWGITWNGAASGPVNPSLVPNTRNKKVTRQTNAAPASPNNNVLSVSDTSEIDVGDVVNIAAGTDLNGVVTVIDKPLSGPNAGKLILSTTHNISNGVDLTFTPLKILSLGADTYTATITGTAGGGACSKVIPYVVTQPAPFTITSLTSPKTISGDANDIICKDADDAYITAAVNGGTSPFNIQYKYKPTSEAAYSSKYGVFTTAIGSWDDTQFTNGLTSKNLAAGFYSVRIKDYNGVFTNDVEIQITEPNSGFIMPIVAATAAVNGAISSNTTALVVDSNVGVIKVGDVVTGKQTNGSTFSRVVSGIVDQQNLVLSSAVNPLEDNTVLTFTNVNTLSLTDVSCFGLGDGKAEFDPDRGNEIDSIKWYKWSGSTKNHLSGYLGLTSVDTLLEGSYTVELTDAFGCVQATNYAINEPEVLSLDETITNVVCPTTSSAKVNGDYSGGSAASRINVDTNDGTIAVGDVVTGSGISGMVLVTTVHSQLDISLSAVVTLNDNTDLTFSPPGKISVIVGGANSNTLNSQFYEYQWDQGGVLMPLSQVTNTGTSTTQLTVTEAGNYTLNVTDFNGCSYTTKTTQFQETYPVNIPSNISVALTTVSGVNAYGKDSVNVSAPFCKDGNDGYILIDVAGGTPNPNYGYRYSWYKDGAATVFASSEDISDLENGVYDVVVTDGNGCTFQSIDYTITSPSSSYHIESLLTPTPTVLTNPTCNGDLGSIAVVIDDDDDGAHPSGYTYSWYRGQAATGSPFNTTNTKLVSGLAAGYYTFEVNDYYGCVKTQTYQVEEYPIIVITSNITELSCPDSKDAKIEIEASGGNAVLATDYTYSWIKDGDPFPINAPNTNTDLLGLDSGVFIVTVSDQSTTAPNKAACVVKDTLTVNYLAGFQVEEVITPAPCKGGTTSAISVDISGGTAPYTQQWKLGGVFVGNGTSLDNLVDGTYRLIVTDVNNCTSAPGDFDYAVSAPTTTYNLNPAKVVSRTVLAAPTETVISPVVCNGESSGSVEVKFTIDAGHPTDYDYAWYAGKTATGPKIENEKVISGISEGDYTFQVTDENGCVKEATYYVQEYTAMQISSRLRDNVCGGDQIGLIEVEANGGNSLNYDYVWSKNGTTFNPADSAWTDTEIDSLASGIYRIIITDEQGCPIDKVFEITNVPSIQVFPTVTNVVCKDSATGEINVRITGGNAPYSQTWDKYGIYVDDTTTISRLDSGTYTLSVVDALNCPTVVQDVVVTEPVTTYTINPIIADVSCYGSKDGTINIGLRPDNGHPFPFAVNWVKDGELFDSDKFVVKDLNSGDYQVSITDPIGCTRYDSVTVFQPDKIFLHPTLDTLECFNGTDAKITLDPTGGSESYPTIIWRYNAKDSPDTITTEDIAFAATDLTAGAHLVTLVDKKGCTKDSTIILYNPPDMVVDPAITNVLCQDGSTGVITASMVNGNAPFEYSWVDYGKVYNTTNTIDSLAAGDYYLAVQDKFFCLSDTFTITVTEPNNRFNINGDITRITCRDSSDAQILLSIEVLGESTDFTYEWEKEGVLISESQDQIDIPYGTYTVGATDNFGCERSNSFTIENPDAVNVTSTQENMVCWGDSTGLIALSPTGGWGNFRYEWKRDLVPLPINESFGSALPAGDYIIDVIDEGLCETPVYVTLTGPDTVKFDIATTNLTCPGDKDGTITASVTGGTGGYTYNWAKDGEPFSQNINLARIAGGEYELIITDDALCEYSSGIIEITEPQTLSLEVLSLKNNLCTTTSNGEFTIAASGGTGEYVYRINGGDPFPNNYYGGLRGGDQNIEITDENLCTYDTTLVVETDYLLVADFDLEYDYPYIDWPISLFDASKGPEIIDWSWDLGNGALVNEVNARNTYVSPAPYPITLKITNAVGCEAVSTQVLDVEKGFRVTVPSAFTPNQDGLNDYFRPTLENIVSMYLVIFNKYGSVVFETNDLDGEWDGSLNQIPLPQDSYLYEITYEAESGIFRTSRGKVAMLR
mgnify:CR=1 FL=1